MGFDCNSTRGIIMANKKQEVLEKSLSTKREFSYRQKKVDLKFTLNIDSSSEAQSFLICLKEAIKDVEKIIGKESN